MDEEKESLRRQIQLLQGLINNHKSIHGNAPAANPRWHTPSQPHGDFCGRGYRQSNQDGWRKKYSLVNRTPQGTDSPAGSACITQKVSAATDDSEKPGQPKLSSKKDEDSSSFTWRSATTQQSRTQTKLSANAAAPSTSLPSGVQPVYSGGRSPAQTQGPHKGILRGASEVEQNMSSPPANKTIQAQVPAATQKPLVVAPRTEGNCSPPKPASSLQTISALSSPQQRNQTVATIKVTKSRKTKYSWVADTPRAPPMAKKVSPSAKKVSSDGKQKAPEATVMMKGRKNGANPKVAALKSRYKWKAENVVSSREASSTPNHSSASHKGAQRSGPVTPQHSKAPAVMAAATASFRDSAPYSYKVKSKTKIIKRRSTSRSPTDKKSSPLAPLLVRSHYCLRRRSSPRMKSPCTVKRSSPRGLVHLSKHRLRRLPPPGKQQNPPSREAASASRVINTRYRIVKRSGTPPLVTSSFSTLGSLLNWRTRLLLLNRLRLNQNQQRWRSRGLCFIGGVMYRVSANKLSKTWSPGSGSKQTPKTGKLDVSSTSPGSLYPSRSATPSRYIASRAIQRSLAIIRQAQQKKEKKEYCMYYNRFGKCNRGQKCPYIHDPEKVAVCTRFLRGTCKKTDGTCPFSHQVSKDKMPVCSYFLKGICRNNDCPYSHVYVSRKAEVCQDFLKGYCPMGAKCKKKHTLLCPDYARDGKCPQGSKCKLQHRQRKRRLDVAAQAEQTSSSAKQSRKMMEQAGTSPATTCAHDDPPASDEELPGSSGRHTCLSYISLNCSSSSEGTPVSERAKSAQNSGEPLQIKPRL